MNYLRGRAIVRATPVLSWMATANGNLLKSHESRTGTPDAPAFGFRFVHCIKLKADGSGGARGGGADRHSRRGYLGYCVRPCAVPVPTALSLNGVTKPPFAFTPLASLFRAIPPLPELVLDGASGVPALKPRLAPPLPPSPCRPTIETRPPPTVLPCAAGSAGWGGAIPGYWAIQDLRPIRPPKPIDLKKTVSCSP